MEAALARGHEVTLFNRGETNPELFPELEKLRGDRDGDLSALEGREWDAVIDPSGFVPRIVRASAELLRGSGQYVFVSSGSVYAEPYFPGYDESAPTVELEDPASEEVLRDYGALKAACEDVVRDVFPDTHTNVRAGLIVGPHDGSGRFTYWPLRASLGGDVLAPGTPEQLTQFIDVRDLGSWILFPRRVEILVAGESGDFERVADVSITQDEKSPAPLTRNVSAELRAPSARHVRVRATNYGPIPSCPGPGQRPWIFVDQIVVE